MRFNQNFWGNTVSILAFLLITVAGGYEITAGIRDKHVQSSFWMVLLSFLLFLARFFYAKTSGANKSIKMELYGVFVMGFLLFLHLLYN